jgi:hypothetical protein
MNAVGADIDGGNDARRNAHSVTMNPWEILTLMNATVVA